MNLSRHSRHTSAYRAILRAYPKSFRQDYGEPMTQLFADRVRDVGAKTWLRVVPDLARTVPQQRIEAFVNSNRALPVVIVTVVVGVFAIIGTGGPGIVFIGVVPLTFLALTQRNALTSLFGGDRVPLRRAVTQSWWAPLAALMAFVEIGFGVVNALDASNLGGRVFGSTILWIMGGAMLYALTRRPFARASANGLILIGSVPWFALFWAIIPPIMGIVLWTGVIRDGFDHERAVVPAS